MSYAIRTVNLTKTYTVGNQKIEALRGINLSIEKGKMIALTGPSGCGKSTLLHLLGGLDYPSLGEVFIEDNNISLLGDKELARVRNEKIGYIFQDFSLLEEMNVRENILMPLLISRKTPNFQILDELMSKLGIIDRQNHMPFQLSGGQQQRVAIARALIHNPAVILCDEPTGNLDKKNSADVIDMIKRIHKLYKKTIIIVTHDMNIASQADYVLKMEDGRILS